jgi:phage tail-like protein
MKQADLLRLLPAVFQQTAAPGSPLVALLAVMEAMHAPSEVVIGRLGSYFDPYQTPDEFVPFLAGWVDLTRFLSPLPGGEAHFPTGFGRLRELMASAAYLSSWRGTARGLLRFLEIATGVPGFVVDEQVMGPDNRPRPFHIRIVAPQAAQSHQSLIERIIESEKPAYVTYELEFARLEQTQEADRG